MQIGMINTTETLTAMNTPQPSIIDQIADERDELRDENQRLNNRMEIMMSDVSHVARIAKERDDALERVKRLERIVNEAKIAFFSDGTDKSTAADMLFILNQSKL